MMNFGREKSLEKSRDDEFETIVEKQPPNKPKKIWGDKTRDDSIEYEKFVETPPKKIWDKTRNETNGYGEKPPKKIWDKPRDDSNGYEKFGEPSMEKPKKNPVEKLVEKARKGVVEKTTEKAKSK